MSEMPSRTYAERSHGKGQLRAKGYVNQLQNAAKPSSYYYARQMTMHVTITLCCMPIVLLG